MPLFNYLKTKILALLANTSNPSKGDALIGFQQTVSVPVSRTVHDKLTELISVKDFGARGDGQGDDYQAIQDAVNSFNEKGGTLFFPAGNYVIRRGILISDLRITLQGAGRHATMITFLPDQDNQTLFRFDRGAQGLSWQCAIRDMALVSSADTGLTKTAIGLKDTSNMIVKDLIIGPWTGNGDSIGLEVRGREAGLIQNLHIHADRPLVIGKNDSNPNNDLDHFHFTDLYLLVSESVQEPCIYIQDGVDMQNIIFDGFQAWVLGSYGLYWKDTMTNSVSLAIAIKNVRTEQGTDPDGYTLHIERNHPIQDLLVENVVADNTQRGFYFRNINRLTLRHVLHNGSDIALDVDGVEELSLDQVLMGTNSEVCMSNMQEKFALNRLQTNSPVPDTAFFIKKEAPVSSLPLHFFGSTKVWTYSGDLKNEELLVIPAGNNEGRKTGIIFVSAISTDQLISAGGQVIDNSKEAILLSGTANFDVGNINGKLTVLHTNATNIYNRLGKDIKLLVQATWY